MAINDFRSKSIIRIDEIKEISLFDKLINLYKETIETHQEDERLLKVCLEKKTYEMVPQLNASVEIHLKFKKSLKNILRENFQIELDAEIEILEKEYKKQQDFSKSAWEMYGSELAGDFNKGEVKVGKRLNLLKGILK
jgi:hypothetical protein